LGREGLEDHLNQYDLEGRVAVVTGAAGGFGSAITRRFLASGASVSMWDRHVSELAALSNEMGSPGRTHSVAMDVTSYDQVSAAADAAIAQFGKIDILVANAGIAGPVAKTWEFPVEAWREVVDVDLNGIFYCCRAVVPHMIASGYGRIVTMGSVAGKDGNMNASAYSAAKAGVIAMTKSLGKELAAHNIAVNVVTPGVANTRILKQITPEHVQFMLSKIPRGRFLEVDELVSLVTWLSSEENSFSTGAVFDLSGGRSTY
jgi:3-oxoacyl-[acyl-carrier protein] reductase